MRLRGLLKFKSNKKQSTVMKPVRISPMRRKTSTKYTHIILLSFHSGDCLPNSMFLQIVNNSVHFGELQHVNLHFLLIRSLCGVSAHLRHGGVWLRRTLVFSSSEIYRNKAASSIENSKL
jgi:hypothetical protein